jgi:hypothetical protein
MVSSPSAMAVAVSEMMEGFSVEDGTKEPDTAFVGMERFTFSAQAKTVIVTGAFDALAFLRGIKEVNLNCPAPCQSLAGIEYQL